MALQLRIDQAGLSDGLAGTSRTDGLATGALVTLINTGSGSTTAFRLLWTPPGDTTAVASLVSGVDPKVWTFEPTPAKYGTYLIELIEDEGLVTELRERRAFVVRTPGRRLVIPALNERGDPRASLVLAGSEQVEAAENNAVDYLDSTLGALPYAAWWRTIHELTMAIDERPFLHTRYVDGRTTVPDYQQTGSVDRPFRLLQSAINSIPTTLDGYTPIGGVLLITGAGTTYLSEGLTLTTSMVFAALGSGDNSSIPAARVVIGALDCQGHHVEFRNVSVAGSVLNAAEVRATESSFFGGVDAAAMRCRDCAMFSLGTNLLFAANCTISGDVVFVVAEILNSALSSFTVTGDSLDIDRYSFERGKAAGGDFSTVTTVSVLDRAGTFSTPEQVEVTVPVLAGGASTTVDVATTGTALEGIDVQNLVVANPTDDDAAGIFRSVRVTSVDSLRFGLQGPYAGGAVNFLVSRLY